MALSHPEEQKRFDRSLETGKPYRTTFLGNEYSISAQAMGRFSSPQFTMMVRPGDYSSSWLDMDVPRPRVPGMSESQPFEADHPEYQELEQEIMKNGVLRPVIIGEKRNMMIPESGPTWPNRTLAHPLLDGHHRAFFAIKHGLDIPVSLLKKHY
jgi:hypothetical protein